jgi:hypothetical protein
MFIILNLLFNT